MISSSLSTLLSTLSILAVLYDYRIHGIYVKTVLDQMVIKKNGDISAIHERVSCLCVGVAAVSKESCPLRLGEGRALLLLHLTRHLSHHHITMARTLEDSLGNTHHIMGSSMQRRGSAASPQQRGGDSGEYECEGLERGDAVGGTFVLGGYKRIECEESFSGCLKNGT